MVYLHQFILRLHLWKHKFSLDITLEKGMISLSGILSGTKSYGKEKINIIKKINNGKVIEKKFEFVEDKSWQREIKYFLKIIEDKKTNSYSGGFNDAYETMKLIEMIYKSSKN